MELFIIVALLLVLFGLRAILSLLGLVLELPRAVLSALFKPALSSSSSVSGFGSHSQDKEQDLWISRLEGLDMFELNRLKFEQSLEHRMPELHTSEFASTSVCDQAEQSYTISIFDQIFTITCKQMEGLQIIQELLSEISTAAPGINIRMCSSGLMPSPQAGMLGAAANIRNQLRLAVTRGNEAALGRSL